MEEAGQHRMVGEIVGIDESSELGEGTGFEQEARSYSVFARKMGDGESQAYHCHCLCNRPILFVSSRGTPCSR